MRLGRVSAGDGGRSLCSIAPELLLAMREPIDGVRPAELALRAGKAGRTVASDTLALSGADGRPVWLIAVVDPGPDPLTLATGEPLLGPGVKRCGIAAFAQRVAERLDGAGREPALEFLCGAADAHGIPIDPELAARLATIRNRLRDPWPRTEITPGVERAARLEHVTAIDDRAFWLSGWIRDQAPERARLAFISPEGSRCEPAPGAVSLHPRPDVDKVLAPDQGITNVGFHAYIESRRPSCHPHGWLLELRSADGAAFEDPARNAVDHDHDRIRRQLTGASEPSGEVTEGQLLPALKRLRALPEAVIAQLRELGEVPGAPDISIVLAAARPDMIAHHLVGLRGHFGDRDVELIVVVPPTMTRFASELAGDLHQLFDVGFRIAVLSGSASRARALNLGAGIARGRLLALLRDDVIAPAWGWLGQLREFHDAHPSAGVLAPMLVAADGSVAELGVQYRRGRASRRWERWFPLKGLAPSLAGTRPRRVTALSDGCVVIAAERFRSLGGLAESYLGDEHAVSDLCLRLADEGLGAWCVAAVELWSLEDASWSAPAADRFDDWLLDRRWGPRLAAACGPPASSPVPSPSPSQWSAPALDVPVEILEVVAESPAAWIVSAGVFDAPRARERDPFADAHAVPIEGWAIARDGGELTAEVSAAATAGASSAAQTWTTPVDVPRRDIAQRFAGTPGADAAGFQTALGTLDLPPRFELAVDVVRAAGERSPVARIRGRRRPLQTGFAPALQPVLVTTLGRTGSSWVQLLLDSHPEIVGCWPFIHDARLTSYWVEVLRTLAGPASYVQALRPELYPGNWWTGEQRPGRVPIWMDEPQMATWLGRDNVTAIAGFCQSRIDEFYREVARVRKHGTARYFVEKCWPDDHIPRLVAELYPDGREILLVRDFRDMVCSIISYNAKRRTQSFGREATDSDEQLIGYLRASALSIVAAWHDRRERAFLLRYEDLVAAPEATLAEVFRYLGVAADAATVANTLSAAAAELPDAQRRHRTAASQRDSIGRWKRELSPEHKALCDGAFGDLLDELGYEPTFAHATGGP